jgi:hypothetical protein
MAGRRPQGRAAGAQAGHKDDEGGRPRWGWGDAASQTGAWAARGPLSPTGGAGAWGRKHLGGCAAPVEAGGAGETGARRPKRGFKGSRPPCRRAPARAGKGRAAAAARARAGGPGSSPIAGQPRPRQAGLSVGAIQRRAVQPCWVGPALLYEQRDGPPPCRMHGGWPFPHETKGWRAPVRSQVLDEGARLPQRPRRGGGGGGGGRRRRRVPPLE